MSRELSCEWKDFLKKTGLLEDLLSAAYSAQMESFKRGVRSPSVTCVFLAPFINCNLFCR